MLQAAKHPAKHEMAWSGMNRAMSIELKTVVGRKLDSEILRLNLI